ncbi:beta-1,4-glucuronyltransferase 1-like [Ptychodera flava]|uniref:beta-1,4-glucuronyltransferase 1-like n=1 Tax=Ptychodera flava TaxID=63121 RepID=UPI00396A5761
MAIWILPRRKFILNLKSVIVIVAIFIVVRQMSSVVFLSRGERGNLKLSASHVTSAIKRHVKTASIAQHSDRKYTVHTYMVASEAMMWSKVKGEDVTIATHCTSAQVHHLASLAERWHAPISVAVLTSDVAPLLNTITNLRRCFPPVKQHVSFHIVHTIEEDDSHEYSQTDEDTGLKVPCNLVVDQSLDAGDQSEVKNDFYPTNLLQNIAWKETLTDYIFPVDIDILPSGELEQNFKAFVQEQKVKDGINPVQQQRVFITPGFDMRSDIATMPKYKAELLQFWEKDSIFPHKSFVNYTKWKNVQANPDRSLYLDISYETEGQSPWGVYFIGSRDMPMYDDSFTEVGLSRTSQICELHLAGYKFAVLDSAFVLRKRFKKTQDSVSIGEDNAKLRTFEEELKKLYPKTDRHCV